MLASKLYAKIKLTLNYITKCETKFKQFHINIRLLNVKSRGFRFLYVSCKLRKTMQNPSRREARLNLHMHVYLFCN